MDCILVSMEYTTDMKLKEPTTDDPYPPAFLYRKFRVTDKETWEILPRLIAEWTLLTIPEREPNVSRARLCLSIPEDVDRDTEKRMQMAFMLWLTKGLERI